MDSISNLDIYVSRMQKSFLDKMFFMDKVFEPVKTILDFGCANGVLIRAMKFLFPEYRYIGYDISEDMIAKAKALVENAEFYDRWSDIPMKAEDTLINISSTLHEVYSYGTEESVNEFWNRVFHSGFRYIAIRDMMLSDNIRLMSDPQDVRRARNLYPDRLKMYESVWGPIDIRFNLIHYLLKYSYTENWDREVRENYLPITVETLLGKIPDDYEIVYSEHYVLPFNKQKIRKDSGIDLKDATHFKILLKRRG